MSSFNHIARLDPVPLRDLWRHEEYGFSAWLEHNLELLSEAVGISLTNPVREKQVGRFSLDVLAESPNGQVIIENQLEATNHDHLGKVLTYLANLEAKVAIWVAGEVRAEHAETIRWLNEFTPDDVAFYLVQLSAFRIGDSAPAPHFAIVAGPTETGRSVGKEKKEVAEGRTTRQRFWQQLLDRARAAGVMTHAQRSPSTDYWLTAGAGIQSGVSYNYNIWKDSAAVNLWIQNEDAATNKRIFDSLLAKKNQMERDFGAPLLWERLDDKRASRIRFEIDKGGLDEPEERWPEIQDAMIDGMRRLAKAIQNARAGEA